MITLTRLLQLIRTSDALSITIIANKVIHPADREDFEIGKGSLWVSERVSWRRELALALGYGCTGVESAEEAVESNKASPWVKSSADQRRDLLLQKVMMAEVVQEYLFMLNEEGDDVEWVVKDGAWRRVFKIQTY
ncbi:hypothetical protein VC83_08144 [Pseudogymnoascus destructans]|uniref:Uncharacterized protein n=2 Tax=Pseudogymnoascus destructans TaxID=655981 RepID=L8FZU6_PSED2|nr:uncharacterized protein VC83_08144 [Pseudogymnoascus destructans]ELR05998.1 hypothetical protein GMDG_01959 [Pseudogymnoascus destructans 20631-21]OAF55304.1 hypothetical protein VC83_08144 [Pseudogymnoascus destructans]